MILPVQSKLVLFFAVVSLLSAADLFASGGNLYPLFHDKIVKVFVNEIKDSTQEHEVDPKLVKTKIEDALKKRKSINFQIVDDPSNADILIDAQLNGFMWTDHDPVDMLVGTAAIAYDIATIEDYASLDATLSVVDAKNKKALWKERLNASVTKKPMPRQESVPLVSEELAKLFIKNCFSKNRSK